MTGFGFVQGPDKFIQIQSRFNGWLKRLNEMADPLFTTGNSQQPAVSGYIPVPIKTRFGKSPVEGHPVTIPLGIREGAIHIEQKCFQIIRNRIPI